MFTKEAQELASKVYEAIKKISKGKWEWEPKAGGGEWCIYNKKPHLIVGVGVGNDLWLRKSGIMCYMFEPDKRKKIIPLLHWERIEEILEGMGYRVYMEEFYMDRSLKARKSAECKIYKYGEDLQGGTLLIKIEAKSCQLAVMRAVIELGKEM